MRWEPLLTSSNYSAIIFEMIKNYDSSFSVAFMICNFFDQWDDFSDNFSDNFSDDCSTVDKRQTRPYIAPAHLCSYCDKIVHGSSTHLRYHVNAVHLKVWPYKCSFCDRSFAVKHKRKHHEIKFHKSSVDANFGTDYKRDGL